MTAEEHIKRHRRDAEKSERDSLAGIKMLRNWLRGLHIDVVIGHDVAQDLTQDDIAKALDEYPRGHHREFKVRDHIDMSADRSQKHRMNSPTYCECGGIIEAKGYWKTRKLTSEGKKEAQRILQCNNCKALYDIAYFGNRYIKREVP